MDEHYDTLPHAADTPAHEHAPRPTRKRGRDTGDDSEGIGDPGRDADAELNDGDIPSSQREPD